ncbi:MAG: hypothetical protein QG605_1897 [Euryarchaeota archaeon]|nr:hypothetical protein [Euryarchaeota archaeon]
MYDHLPKTDISQSIYRKTAIPALAWIRVHLIHAEDLIMGIKESFTDEEWRGLVSLPYAVSMAIVLAAPSLLGTFHESKALITEPAKLAASASSDLVGILSGEIQSRGRELIDEQKDLFKKDQNGYRSRTIEACRSAAAALTKVSSKEAAAYKEWVLAIGQKVAEAAKEQGVAVSEPEEVLLNEVSAALARAHKT